MPPDRNLAILHTPINEDEADWFRVRALIGERAPDIEVRIARNDLRDTDVEAWQSTRPALVFAVCPLWQYRPAGGKVYAGKPMSKLEEHERLVAAGLPVPRMARLTRDLVLDGSDWGEFVVVKPARGSFGRGVHLVPAAELATRFDAVGDPGGGSVVQSFVEHVDDQGRPTTHRVLTMFGKALYAIRSSWREPRGSVRETAEPGALLAANTGERDRERELLDDPEIVALAENAAAAVPDVPVLGVDIIRETGTGRLWILELNASGTVWHLSSETGKTRYPGSFRRRLYRQFNALDRAADLLIERTRAEAR